MAQLRDTLIQGSARVTDTLYTTNIAGGTFIAPLIWKDNTALSEKTSADYFLTIDSFTNGGKTYWTTKENALTSLGALPLTGGTVTGTLILSKSTDASGTAHNLPALIVGNTAGNAHLEFDGNEIMAKSSTTTVNKLCLNADGGIISIGENIATAATTTANNETGLEIRSIRGSNSPIIRAYSYIQTASGYQWGLDHLVPNLQAGANTCLLTGVANSANNQSALEFHYAGSNNNGNYVGLGLYGNNGLLKIYKDKHVEFAGTIKTGVWEGTAIAAAYIGEHSTDKLTSGTLGVARGGTGATTFTSDCVVVGNGTNAMASRGLKVTGATDASVTIQANTSGKTLFINSPGGSADIAIDTSANSGSGILYLSSGNTLYINKPTNKSIIFTSGGADTNHEMGRFNTSGMLQLNSNVTQSTHKLLVNGDSAFTGKIAFIDTPAAALTEKVYIQQANNTIQLVAKAINFPTITDGTGIVASDLGANANPRYRPASWKYNAGITPVDGDIVTIKIPSGAADYGTWLSLDNGSTYYPIIHSNGSRLQNWFSSNMSITLRYDSLATCSVYGTVSNGSIVATNSKATITGCWRLITQYDTGNDGLWYLRQYTIKAQTAITNVHIIGGTDAGYNNIDSGTAFDIRYAVLYCGTALGAGATGNNNYIHHYSVNIKDSSGNNISLTTYKNVYIKGTISGTIFTPIASGNPYVQDITAADDNYVYYYIGRAYSTSAISFDATAKKIFWYKNGAIQPYNALGNVSNNANLNSTTGTIGDIIYWSAANTPAHLAKGTAGKFLKMGNNNVPIWGDGSEVTLNGTATTTPSFYAPADSGTVNYLLKSGGANAAPIWDTHASIDSAGMLHILSVKAYNGFWVNDAYFKGDSTQHIKEALVCVDADNMNQGEILYEYNASTSTSRFGLYTYANIYNDTSVNTYLTLGISTDGTVKRTYTDAQIYGAVWNDYAEYRKQLYEIEPGRVVRDLNSGHVVLTEERLIPGAQVVSDTFGFAIGETKECKTPLAVSGRVLVFTTQDRYKYNAGDAVCSGPHGTVDIMTREEIQKYPDAIVGIVSEIPTYDTWGQNEVAVQGRIWIKVR